MYSKARHKDGCTQTPHPYIPYWTPPVLHVTRASVWHWVNSSNVSMAATVQLKYAQLVTNLSPLAQLEQVPSLSSSAQYTS